MDGIYTDIGVWREKLQDICSYGNGFEDRNSIIVSREHWGVVVHICQCNLYLEK